MSNDVAEGIDPKPTRLTKAELSAELTGALRAYSQARANLARRPTGTREEYLHLAAHAEEMRERCNLARRAVQAFRPNRELG
jgi:hypothetical protein